jgi:hypothetical protein
MYDLLNFSKKKNILVKIVKFETFRIFLNNFLIYFICDFKLPNNLTNEIPNENLLYSLN